MGLVSNSASRQLAGLNARPASLPPHLRVASRPAPRALCGGWRCQTGRGREAWRRVGGVSGWGQGCAPVTACGPAPGPLCYSLLLRLVRELAQFPLHVPSCGLAVRREAAPRLVRGHARPSSRAPGSPHARASRARTRSFLLARSCLGGGGGRQIAQGSTVAAAAGWPAGHGGRWGRRADETATHPGNEQGEGATSRRAPRRGALSEADKGGGAAGVAVQLPRPGPGALSPPRGRRASPSPLCGCPGRGCEGAGGRGAEEARVGAAGSAPRASSPPSCSAQLGRDPGAPAGPARPPVTPTISSFLSAALAPLSLGVLPGRGLSSGCLGAGVQISPSKTHLPSPYKEKHTAPPVSSSRQW